MISRPIIPHIVITVMEARRSFDLKKRTGVVGGRTIVISGNLAMGRGE